jgi:hypothetical protein
MHKKEECPCDRRRLGLEEQQHQNSFFPATALACLPFVVFMKCLWGLMMWVMVVMWR